MVSRSDVGQRSPTPSSAPAHHSSTFAASHSGHATTRAASPSPAPGRIASTGSHDEPLHRSIILDGNRKSAGSDNNDSNNTTARVSHSSIVPEVLQRRPSTATGLRTSSSSTYKLFPSPRDSHSPQTSPASLQRETLKNAVAELGRKRRSSSLEPRLRLSRSSSSTHLHHAAVSSVSISASSAQHTTAAADQVTTTHSFALASPSIQDLNISTDPYVPSASFAATRGHGQINSTTINGDAPVSGMMNITPMSTVLEAGDSPNPASAPVPTNPTAANTHAPFSPRIYPPPSIPVSRPLTPSQSHSTSSSTVSAITAACETAAHGRPRAAPYESACPSPVSPLLPRDQAFTEAMNNPPKTQYVWSSRHAAASQQTLHGLGLSLPAGAPPDSPLTPRSIINPPKMHEEKPPPPPPKSPRWHNQWAHINHSRESSDNSISKISLKSDGTVLDAEFISPAKPTLFDLQMMPGYKANVSEGGVGQKPKMTVITRPHAPESAAVSNPSNPTTVDRGAVVSATYSPGDGSGDVYFPTLQRDEAQPTKRKHKPAPLQIHTNGATVEPELLTSAIYTPSSNILGKDDSSRAGSPALPIKPFATHVMPHSPGFPSSPSHALSGNPVGRPSVLQSRGNSALSNIITATRARSPTPDTGSSNILPSKDAARSEKRPEAAPSSTLARLREEARIKAEEASKSFSVEAGDYLQSVDRDSRRPSARTPQPRGRSIEPAMKSPTIKAAVDATDSLRDFANSMDTAPTSKRPWAIARTNTPDVYGDGTVDNGPDPMDTLTTLGKQSEALHQRYNSLRSQRQKVSSDLSAALNNPKPGPDFNKILMDCHISLNTINSSMDICFAKLQSLDCRKEEAIHSLKIQTAAKLKYAEERQAESVSLVRSQVVRPVESGVRTRASKESFQQPDSTLTAIARASADSLKPYELPAVDSRPRTSEGSRTDSPLRTSDTPKPVSYDDLESRATAPKTSDAANAREKPEIHRTAKVDVDYPRVIRNVPDKAANMPPPVAKPNTDDAPQSGTTGKRFVPRSKRRQLDIKVVGGPVAELPAAPGPAPASPLPEIPTFKDAAASKKPATTSSTRTTPSSSWSKTSALSQSMTNENSSTVMDRKRPQRRSNSPPGTSDSSAPDEPPEAKTPPQENKVLTGGKLPSLSSVQVYVDDEVLPAFYGHPLLAQGVRS